MMTDELIRSMKDQMVPSDDVVSDLLAKIAALEATPDATDSNVISFEEHRFKETFVAEPVAAKKAKKTTKKSIWFYSTAAVASVILLVSTFTLMGQDGDPSDLLTDVTGPNVVTNPVGPDVTVPVPGGDPDQTPDPGDDPVAGPNQEDPVTDGDKDGDKDGDEDKPGFLDNLFNNNDEDGDKDPGKTDDEVTPTDDPEPGKTEQPDGSDKETPGKTDGSDGKETPGKTDTTTPPKSDSSTTAPPPPPAVNNNDGSGNYVVDDGKVTPGAPGTGDISFNREILADSAVKNVTILGTNYVVEQASTSAATSSEIQVLSLDIPETSTTKQATVKAKVKKMKNVSSDLMVAMDVDGFKQTLTYTNADYSPETLGQFISDAGLNSATFAKSVYCKGENIGYSSYHRFNVPEINGLVNSNVLANGNAERSSYQSYQNGNVHVTFQSASNPTGSVIHFGVSDNGYLYVKMGSGKTFTFHIGSSSASAFISAVTGQ